MQETCADSRTALECQQYRWKGVGVQLQLRQPFLGMATRVRRWCGTCIAVCRACFWVQDWAIRYPRNFSQADAPKIGARNGGGFFCLRTESPFLTIAYRSMGGRKILAEKVENSPGLFVVRAKRPTMHLDRH